MPSLRTLWEGARAAATEVLFTRSAAFTEKDYPDLSGKTWLVTGASGGIGYEVVLRLVRQNAKVWMLARSKDKLEAAISKLKEEVPSAQVEYCLADLSDLTTIKTGIRELLETESKLDGIIHNAGVMFTPKGMKTKQGYEYQVGVNNIGPHLLQRLVDHLIIEGGRSSGNPSRIVWVSSLALYMSSYEFDEPNLPNKSNSDRYAFSKAVNYTQCVQWTMHHDSANVLSVAVHPGIIETDLFRHTDWVSNAVMRSIKWPAKYGAFTELYGALSTGIDPKSNNNCFIIPFGQIGDVSTELKECSRDNRGGRMWKWLDQETEEFI